MRRFKRRDHGRCRVTVEYCGYFIGRSHCSAHDYFWDAGEPPCGQGPGARLGRTPERTEDQPTGRDAHMNLADRPPLTRHEQATAYAVIVGLLAFAATWLAYLLAAIT